MGKIVKEYLYVKIVSCKITIYQFTNNQKNVRYAVLRI